jgi:hypothetical protein
MDPDPVNAGTDQASRKNWQRLNRMAIGDCMECVRLWQRYSAAATEYISLAAQRDSAAMSGDVPKPQLKAIIQDAERDRKKCRADIDKHMTKAHSKTK